MTSTQKQDRILDAPKFSTETIRDVTDCAYYAFMAGYSYNSSMANLRDYYDDDPEIQKRVPNRDAFIAMGARAVRGWYNIQFADFDDVANYVARAYEER